MPVALTQNVTRLPGAASAPTGWVTNTGEDTTARRATRLVTTPTGFATTTA